MTSKYRANHLGLAKQSKAIRLKGVSVMVPMQRTDRDCLTCCLSEIFNIPYEQIPDFNKGLPADMKDWPEECSEEHERGYREWLKSIGYSTITFKASYDPSANAINYMGVPDEDFLGLAVFRKIGRPYTHVAVIRSINKVSTIEDPKKDSDYLLGDLLGIELFIPVGSLLVKN